MNQARYCSGDYLVMIYQVPITVGTTFYEAVLLYKGKRVIASKGDEHTRLHVGKLLVYCTCGLLAGIIGGLLGLGGGFILGPLFIGLGIPPQVRFILLCSCCSTWNSLSSFTTNFPPR